MFYKFHVSLGKNDCSNPFQMIINDFFVKKKMTKSDLSDQIVALILFKFYILMFFYKYYT